MGACAWCSRRPLRMGGAPGTLQCFFVARNVRVGRRSSAAHACRQCEPSACSLCHLPVSPSFPALRRSQPLAWTQCGRRTRAATGHSVTPELFFKYRVCSARVQSEVLKMHHFSRTASILGFLTDHQVIICYSWVQLVYVARSLSVTICQFVVVLTVSSNSSSF